MGDQQELSQVFVHRQSRLSGSLERLGIPVAPYPSALLQACPTPSSNRLQLPLLQWMS